MNVVPTLLVRNCWPGGLSGGKYRISLLPLLPWHAEASLFVVYYLLWLIFAAANALLFILAKQSRVVL